MDILSIPPELQAVPHWVVWKAGPVKPNDKFDKVPVHPGTGRNLKGDLLPQCMTFDEALAAYKSGRFSGIGFCHRNSPFVFGDLDGVVEDGRVADWAIEDIGRLGTYCEISPSGRGLRWVAIGTKPGPETNNRDQGCELYDGDTKHPFVTITGDALPGFDIVRADIQPEVDAWYWKRIAKSRATTTAPAPEEDAADLGGRHVRLPVPLRG
jgi:primase-polymerase (primpol)-like protein